MKKLLSAIGHIPKKAGLASAFCFLTSVVFSQYKWDWGGNIGASNYLGEMGGKEKTRRDFILDMKLSRTGFAMGGFARYKFNPDLYLKGSLGWYRISGADKLSTNPGRVGRNLSFRNDIFEASVTGQYVFYDVSDLGRTYRYRNDFKAYVFAGAGGAYHNPKAQYNGEWVALAPLHTEGQGIVAGAPKPYGKFLFVVPAGAGFFFTFSKKYRIGWEFNWRTTFTDYLDDASTIYADPAVFAGDQTAVDLANRNNELVYTDDPVDLTLPHRDTYRPHLENGVMVYPKRGDPKHNDSYLSTTLNVSYVIKGKSKFAKSKYKSFFGKKYKRGRTIRAKF